MAYQFAITIFLSAFLLFQVQPLVSKYILPWFGGSPAVWTTCLLFFQSVLFAGYLYAHLSEHYFRRSWRKGIHLTIVVAALAVLPIAPSDGWKPIDSDVPTVRILVLLLACVGLPYFLLSTTGPLIQAWYSRELPGRSPYRLYALSNLGSLLALLSYPFVVEPALSVNAQAWWWSGGFVAFCALCAYATIRSQGPETAAAEADSPDDSVRADVSPSVVRRLLWLGLPAFATMMLMATTHHVTQDVAPIPLLWVVPLSLYLLSFIITFDHPRWYRRVPFALATMAAVYVSVGVSDIDSWKLVDVLNDLRVWKWGPEIDKWDFDYGYRGEIAAHFTTLFLLCMVCHGELYRLRPAPRLLTSFYLMISLGGALGGIFVSFLAPVLFDTFVEWHIGLAVGFLIAAAVLATAPRWSQLKNPVAIAANVSAVLAGVAVVVFSFHEVKHLWSFDRASSNTTLERTRNFYGAISVVDRTSGEPDSRNRALYNGRILHGVQFVTPAERRWPTTYYTERSGVGRALEYYAKKRRMKMGAVGLGVGTLASYAERGHTVRFYEINPEVVRLADKHFTYLKDARERGATVEIVHGDARLSMERELAARPHTFDLLVLDAFSGDAIPNHLLTKEAFEIYLPHLADGGAIAVHVSNRYLDLPIVVYGLAEHFGLEPVTIENGSAATQATSSSTWVILSRNEELLRELRWHAPDNLDLPEKLPLWTDQDHNILEILE